MGDGRETSQQRNDYSMRDQEFGRKEQEPWKRQKELYDIPEILPIL